MPAISQETINAMAIARMSHFCIQAMRILYDKAGSFSAIIEHCNNINEIVADCPQRIAKALKGIRPILERANEEAEYTLEHGINVLTISDPDYPERLKECEDAPLVLFYKGNANLNSKRVINIIGTRHATVYADDCIRNFVNNIKALCPEILIVSGLAYGVDIMAHRHSLENSIPTVGVLAHGLDNLYPPRHRETANKMIECGGLLTEHFTNTNADKINFVRRNRIVAGMSDATVLVESASHGGGLITCSMARSYHRDVFAFPGRVGDKYSEGCNNLIKNNGASLITSAQDLIQAMSWENDAIITHAKQNGIERSLFPDITEEENCIIEILKQNNDMQLNVLAERAKTPVNKLLSLLFELEMKGIVKNLAGGVYHLVV